MTSEGPFSQRITSDGTRVLTYDIRWYSCSRLKTSDRLLVLQIYNNMGLLVYPITSGCNLDFTLTWDGFLVLNIKRHMALLVYLMTSGDPLVLIEWHQMGLLFLSKDIRWSCSTLWHQMVFLFSKCNIKWDSALEH